MAGLTEGQVTALAPDSSSAKAGSGLGVRGPWSGLGCDDRSLWGACRGSGRTPYEVAVDLTGPAFRCSCPSRKFPCKHGLGLLYLQARDPAAVPAGVAPAEVATWLATRAARGGPVAVRRQGAESPLPETAPKPLVADPVAAAATAARRAGRIIAGMAELDAWLGDLVRAGLGAAAARPWAYFDTMGARLVDAQAPAAAASVRRLAGVAASGPGWPERFVAALGRLRLLAGGWSRYDALPVSRQADLRTAAGWPTPSAEVLATGPRLRDHWFVLGRSETEEERVTAIRTWLRGRDSGRVALLLDFARPGAMPAWELWPGNVVDAELAWFPGTPLRVLVAERIGEPEAAEVPVAEDLSVAAAERAAAVAANPFLERWPVAVALTVVRDGGWRGVDTGGREVPLACDDLLGWRLLGASEGRPVPLVGEWRTGLPLQPLACWSGGELVSL